MELARRKGPGAGLEEDGCQAQGLDGLAQQASLPLQFLDGGTDEDLQALNGRSDAGHRVAGIKLPFA